ncbi:MAG: hypothetical protein RL660_463 [Bacteroidota bacterium]|jgi:organic hydroperoxide reductase OsmC/OhrA
MIKSISISETPKTITIGGKAHTITTLQVDIQMQAPGQQPTRAEAMHLLAQAMLQISEVKPIANAQA